MCLIVSGSASVAFRKRSSARVWLGRRSSAGAIAATSVGTRASTAICRRANSNRPPARIAATTEPADVPVISDALARSTPRTASSCM